jgi:hypothetical protein
MTKPSFTKHLLKSLRISFIQLFILMVSATFAFANNANTTLLNTPPFIVTGQVKDENGEHLIGATVSAEGTQKGVLY